MTNCIPRIGDHKKRDKTSTKKKGNDCKCKDGSSSNSDSESDNEAHELYWIVIVLSIEDKLNYLEHLIPPAPVVPAGRHVAPKILAAYIALIKGSKEIVGLMLMTMEPKIQRNLETLHAREMLLELKTLFAQQAGASSDYARFSLLQAGRKAEFNGFVHNCNMHSLGKTINELHAMLKLHEQTLPKNNAPVLHVIRAVLSRVAKEEKERSFGSWWFSSIYAVSNKKAKLDLYSALLWHCRLGHISKKRIEKLQHDGLLNLTDLMAFEKFVSCMSGKMARKPYTHQVEKAKDLLRLIHTDHKHEVFETFKVFQREVENQLGKTIKSLRSDPGGERNRTLLDIVRSMMSQTTLPKSFWDYALETAARILNMILNKKVEKTPYEVWHGKAHKLSHLKVWGCEVLVKRDTFTKPEKLEPISIKCIFIGYPKETIGYSFYYPPENNVLVAQNVEFLENSLITQETSGSLEDLKIIQEEDTHPSIDTSLNHKEDDLEIDEPQSDIVPICRSTRTRHTPDRMCLYIDAEEHELGDLGEPVNYKAAFLDPDKWLFKKKTDMDGVVHTYKARLVVNGYTQTPGIDYEETFSPVADIRAIRILIATTMYYDYKIWQMDVKTFFLNGYLNKEVYMEQPEGFVNSKYPNRVKLHISLESRSTEIDHDEKLKLSKSQGTSTPTELKRMKNVPYASGVGSIMYAVRCTRPDVAFAQNVTSRFQQNPGHLHWTTIKNILKYLRNTKDMFLVYGETEYIASFDASKEVVWVRKFISELGIVPTIKEPIGMYCDDTRAIVVANESGITKSARHFCAKVHYLHEVIEYGDVKLEKVHIDDNLADPFTKALAFPKHSEQTRNIGMLSASSLM
uniref:Retrotransposon protein, putative, Ty1-copia subclass n=1 Tax=Tanacetum cinerariifolium TaxID=118510 RepID=A0A6L2MES0_TANCI|nr:hypothetical protein [Tanacetum cinerariifolium]